jgi:hypothetical protein
MHVHDPQTRVSLQTLHHFCRRKCAESERFLLTLTLLYRANDTDTI